MREIESFIAECVKKGRIFWTYHINMRLKMRNIDSEEVLQALKNCSVIESYPEDSPLPSYLVFGKDRKNQPIHIVLAIDTKGKNIRIITSYRPTLEYWNADLKTRRRKK